MQYLFKCMKNVSVQNCVCEGGRGSEFIGNQGMQLEKLQWFEGVQYIYIYIYIYI